MAIFTEIAYLENIFISTIIIIVSIFTAKIFHFLIKKISAKLAAARRISLTAKEARHYAKPLNILVNLIVSIIAIVIILNLYGLQGSVLGVLSAAGFLGIIVGFASKDTLGNLMAGMIIFIDKPFLIGDWVDIAGLEGEVIDMHVATTRMRSWDGELVVIPNSMVINEKIINKTIRGKLRIKIPVSIDYSSDIKKAVKVSKNLLVKDPRILDYPEPQVLVREFSDSAIKLELRGWMEPDKNSTVAIKNDLHHKIKEVFDKNGITIPFPQVTISKR